MHQKQKGNVAESAVATDLLKQGFAVFTELGDLSKSDLIAIVNDVPVRIQVKYKVSKTNNSVCVELKKSGPNYRFQYKETDFDVLAVYVADKDHILYISSQEALRNGATITFRYVKAPTTTNNRPSHMADNYMSFRKALTDFTARQLPNNFDYLHTETKPQTTKHRKIVDVCQCGDTKSVRAKLCKKCSDKKREKTTNRPCKELLSMLTCEIPMISIGKMYGVSDNAVRKWCRNYNIDVGNKKGYWTKKQYNKT